MDGNQISDQIVQAINIIAEKKIEAISFDTTIEATIIDDSRASEGIYMVSNGSANFEAVSTETGYKINDAVLVTIPQGDYSKQKIIAGKQVNKTDNSPIIYQSPFETILNMTNNLIGDTSKIGEVGMIANHPNKYCWDVNTKNFTNSIAYTQTYKVEGEDKIVALIWDSEDTLEEGEFNHTQIGIKAQFSTWLEEYGVVSGNYGLAVEIFFTHKDDVMSINAGDTNITQDIIDSHSFSKIIYLDSDSFFGNVYSFESYYTQEKTYDISEYTDFPITRIRLFAYQRNNFKDVNNNKVEYEEDFNSTNSFSSIMPNIFIKDPYICLGAPIEQFTADSAEIITRQGYNYMQDPPELKIVSEDDLEENNMGKEYFEIPPEDNSSEDNSSEGDSPEKFIVGTLFDKNNHFLSLTHTLKPFIRVRHNLFYKYLTKVLLNKSYRRKEIKDIFNALVASKNKLFDSIDNISEKYDWTKNKIKINTGEIQPISDFLDDLLKEENIVFSNEKTLELRWVHKDDITDEVNVISSLPENYKIYWFRYKESVIDVKNRHSLMDAHWDLLESKQEDDVFKITFNPNVKIGKERIQAIVVREDNGVEYLVVKSNILELVNITETVSTTALTTITKSLDDLAIRFDDGSGGNYFLYNRAKKLFSVEKNEVKTLTAVFDENEDIVENKKDLKGPCSVKWTIPANNTMIILGDEEKNNSIKIENENKNVYYVIEKELEENDTGTSLTYKINENLDYKKNNNTVILEVKRFDQTYFTSATMRFGSAGTSGSDYTVVVNWSNDQAVFDISEANNSEYALSGEVSVLDQDGKNIINDNLNYEYSWYKIKCESSNVIESYMIEEEEKKYPINNNAIGRLRILISDNNDIKETPFPYLNSAKIPENEENEDDLDGISSKLDYRLKKDQLKKVAYCYANKIDGGESQGFHHGDGSSLLSDKANIDFYEYDLINHEFKKIEEPINENDITDKILYTTNQIRNEAGNIRERYKITFKPFDRSYGARYKKNAQDSGKDGIMLFKDDNTVEYYYGNKGTKRKAFIEDNGNFIIDPYNQYYDNLIYYYPVFIEEEKIYENVPLEIEKNEEEEKNKFKIKKVNDSLSINDLYILQIKITNLEDYPLIARFPIALKKDCIFDFGKKRIIPDGIKGPTEIRYTTSGEIDFDKTPYFIHLQHWKNEGQETPQWTNTAIEWANTTTAARGKWKIIGAKNSDTLLTMDNIDYKDFLIKNLTNENKKRLNVLYNEGLQEKNLFNLISCIKNKIYKIPEFNNINNFEDIPIGEEDFQIPNNARTQEIKELIDELYKQKIISEDVNILKKDTPILTPLSVYFKELDFYGIQFIYKNGNLNEPLWTQPIYIYQDNYPSTTLNQWSGKEIITDNNTGLIVANGFSAGKKEADNTFTGVVIGDWSKSDTDEIITKQTGIYGFNHGAMSYALKDDGTAFFGADGSGRIYFNGNNAQIYSANWIKNSLSDEGEYQQEQQGMMLDIDNGELYIQKKVPYTEEREYQKTISQGKNNVTEVKLILQDGTSAINTVTVGSRTYNIVLREYEYKYEHENENNDENSIETEKIYLEKHLFQFFTKAQEANTYNYKCDFSTITFSGTELKAITEIKTITNFIDERYLSINENNFFISKKNKNNEDIKMFELVFDNKNYNDFEYALRSSDYIYHTSDDNGKGHGIEINLKNHVITEYCTTIKNNNNENEQYNFKLQVGGSMSNEDFSGFKFSLDTSRSTILRIGEGLGVNNSDGFFSVNTLGQVRCSRLTIGDFTTMHIKKHDNNRNQSSLIFKIKGSSFFSNIKCGRIEIHGIDNYGDLNKEYSLVVCNNMNNAINERVRGNIWCGEINCTSIKINGHTLEVKDYNTTSTGQSPPDVALFLDGNEILY